MKVMSLILTRVQQQTAVTHPMTAVVLPVTAAALAVQRRSQIVTMGVTQRSGKRNAKSKSQTLATQ